MSNEIRQVQYNSNGRKLEVQRAWWGAESKESRFNSVFHVTKTIEANLQYRRQENIRHAKLYANKSFDDYLSSVVYNYNGARMSLNVGKAVTDTATAKIAKEATRAYWLTEDGDYSEQRRAKKLTRFTDGMFYEQQAYAKGRRIFTDACIFGTGVVKVYELDGEVCTERILIDELLVDENEARYGNPRQIHQVKAVDAECLAAQFPKFRDLIYLAETVKARTASAIGTMVKVVESWHLPSGRQAKDGLHTICISNCVLFEEKYDKDYFPFVFFRWGEPLVGFYGEALIAEVLGIQVEINDIVLRIQEAMSTMSVPRVFVERGSKVDVDHINDEIGAIVTYTGTKPTAEVWQAMSQEVYNYLEYLYNKAFLVSGVSQLSASSKKPAGLDSGVALREYQDIETERFALVALRFQQFYLDLAAAYVRLAAETKKPIEVRAPRKGGMEKINWADVKGDLDSFVLKAYPTSILPTKPEGQLQAIQEMTQAGLIPREMAIGLLDYPDLQQWINVQVSGIEDIQYVIEQIVEHGEYIAPEPYMDLQNGIKLAQAAYIRSRAQGLDESKRDQLRNWIDDAIELIQAPPEAPALPAANSLPPPPVATPAPPPVSELMPIQQ